MWSVNDLACRSLANRRQTAGKPPANRRQTAKYQQETHQRTASDLPETCWKPAGNLPESRREPAATNFHHKDQIKGISSHSFQHYAFLTIPYLLTYLHSKAGNTFDLVFLPEIHGGYPATAPS